MEHELTCNNVACRNDNNSRRTHCKQCTDNRFETSGSKKSSYEIGKSAAAHSRGLFKSNDWQCSKCGNVNWAQRTTCNVCNAAKFIDLEQRTGLGGGYNEREQVVYKHRNDYDDEYDEFGRRKKKKDNKEETDDSTEEDELEEDEDEDVDLSKYDLWNEVAESSSTMNNVAPDITRSRSRSPLQRAVDEQIDSDKS